jgi:RNase P subunit RPR2
MIEMYCDHCGQEIPPDVNGGVRVRTGNREMVLHLCDEHQTVLRLWVREFCKEADPREVKNPQLPGGDR